MILAVDVQYSQNQAFVSGISFSDWCASTSDHTYETVLSHIAAYIPGQFYKRELPCILKLLEQYQLSPEVIVVDGYVHLDQQKPGLGMHLYNAIDGKAMVIGVAKKEFSGIASQAKIYRGTSKNPLFVTAIGMDVDKARLNIMDMHGNNRIPVLLKYVDRLCREQANRKCSNSPLNATPTS